VCGEDRGELGEQGAGSGLSGNLLVEVILRALQLVVRDRVAEGLRVGSGTGSSRVLPLDMGWGDLE
jgi:hypothetical protein